MRVRDRKRDNMERRIHDRVELQLSCSLASSGDNPEPLIGVTENISRGGVLIRWNAEPATIPLPSSGNTIAIAVKLPAGPRYLRCFGRVVRVSTMRSKATLVAVEIQRMSFSRETEIPVPETMATCLVN